MAQNYGGDGMMKYTYICDKCGKEEVSEKNQG